MSFSPNDIILEKYRIEKLVGQGAFAKVYLATHLALDAPRALKILHKDTPGLGSTKFSDFHSRFRLEAQLGAKLEGNPHIVQVYDFEQDGETLILVMEYAPGGSLAGRIARARECDKPIPIEESAQMALEVARGLAAIHDLDAVHRDLKPSNILFDKQGRAKVSDVGLAQIPSGPSMRSQFSTAQPHPGTPGYMSPELERIRQYLSPASDIYALGLVLFETLTGRVCRGQPPGTRVHKLRPEIPKWLDKLTARMLSEKPEDRPWNGEQAAQLLQDGLEGKSSQSEKVDKATEVDAPLESKQSVTARETETQAPQKQRKHREKDQPGFWNRIPAWIWGVGGLGIVGLLMITGIIIAVILRNGKPPETETVVETVVVEKEVAVEVTPEITNTIQTTNTQRPTNTPRDTLEPTIKPTETPSPTETPHPTDTPKPTDTPEPDLDIGSTKTSEKDNMKMLYIPAGRFEMGGDADEGLDECQELYEPYDNVTCERSWFKDEEPPHSVYVDAFWMDEHEVTNAQYEECVADGDCDPPQQRDSYTRSSYYGDSSYDFYPVIYVSWYDARDYCDWAERRLPTEAEWEKAARGPEEWDYPWGDSFRGNDMNFCDKRCQFNWANSAYNDGYKDTSPVGSFDAFGYGLHDMAGNVWEWVKDWYDVYPGGDSSASDVFGAGYRVLRGSSWANSGNDARSTYRLRREPGVTKSSVGFRCAMDAEP